MAFAVRLAQVGNGEFGVVLEGVEGLVSEQFLDVVHVRAGAQKLRRTRSAERVRRDVDGDADGIGVVVHEPPEDVIRKALALGVEEDGLLGPVAQQERPHGREVALGVAQGRLADRDDALLAALAVDKGRGHASLQKGHDLPSVTQWSSHGRSVGLKAVRPASGRTQQCPGQGYHLSAASLGAAHPLSAPARSPHR